MTLPDLLGKLTVVAPRLTGALPTTVRAGCARTHPELVARNIAQASARTDRCARVEDLMHDAIKHEPFRGLRGLTGSSVAVTASSPPVSLLA
jgi:hypothetical protein